VRSGAVTLQLRKNSNTIIPAEAAECGIPLSLGLLARSVGQPKSLQSNLRRSDMKKLRVLIVDDSSVMRRIIERSLRQAGLDLTEVLEASNGAEALTEAQKGSLDIILSDINMPVMDGLEFLKNLAKVDAAKGVPVVMITTEGSEARVVEALSAGAKGYLRKPFTPEQVIERVAPLLGIGR
jgi:two-component system chemotaxis response regulator CheY